jgi:hypothetical protein
MSAVAIINSRGLRGSPWSTPVLQRLWFELMWSVLGSLATYSDHGQHTNWPFRDRRNARSGERSLPPIHVHGSHRWCISPKENGNSNCIVCDPWRNGVIIYVSVIVVVHPNIRTRNVFVAKARFSICNISVNIADYVDCSVYYVN